jgi:hypothetical protein
VTTYVVTMIARSQGSVELEFWVECAL